MTEYRFKNAGPRAIDPAQRLASTLTVGDLTALIRTVVQQELAKRDRTPGL